MLAFFPYCATESVREAGAGLASVNPPAPQTKECEGKVMEQKLGMGLELLLLGDSNLCSRENISVLKLKCIWLSEEPLSEAIIICAPEALLRKWASC